MRGDVETALAESDVVVEGEFETSFVEHAYIEPEAGFARRVNDPIDIQACTQAPYMDRADIAKILGIAPEAVRIIPTAVGGVSERSWICPCNRLWRWQPGFFAGRCVWCTRVRNRFLYHQATSREHSPARGRNSRR